MRNPAALASPFLLSLSLLSGASCTKGDSDGNLMVYHGAYSDDVKTFDPANAYDGTSLDIVPSVYETLFQYAYMNDTYKVVPLLAADLPKYSQDRLTITIPIRRDVRYQDDPCFRETHGKGRALKAQDFELAFKRLALPGLQSQGWWIFDGKIVGVNAFHDKLLKTPKGEIAKAFAEKIEGIQALDDSTLQLKLLKPYPQLLAILVMTFTAPIPSEAVAAYADENGNLTDHPVGTGPFILKTWERGHRLVLERNPNFHPEFYPSEGSIDFRKRGLLADAGKPLPFLDRVSFTVIHEAQPRWLKFMKGELDQIAIPKDNFGQAISNQVNLTPELAAKGIRLSIDTGGRFYYVSFNMKDKVLGGNKFLRQALSSAVDRDKWIELFTNGRGRKMVNALPPGLLDRPKTDKIKFDYNPTLARALLRKAGFPDGKGLPMLNFDMRGADSVNRQMGEFFAQQFAAIGLKINVIYNTFPAYLEKMKQGNIQISYGGWGLDYPDAENVYQLLYGPNKAPGPGEANYDDPEMNRLYEQMAIMEPGTRRAELIQRMDDLLQEDCPWALGYYHADYELTQPWLLNYRSSEIITNKYKYLRLNRDVKRRYMEHR